MCYLILTPLHQISTLMSGLTREMRDFTDSTKHVLEQLDRPQPSPLPTFLDQPCDDLDEACQDTEFVAEAHDVARQWTDIAGQWTELCQEISEKVSFVRRFLLFMLKQWKKSTHLLSCCAKLKILFVFANMSPITYPFKSRSTVILPFSRFDSWPIVPDCKNISNIK